MFLLKLTIKVKIKVKLDFFYRPDLTYSGGSTLPCEKHIGCQVLHVPVSSLSS